MLKETEKTPDLGKRRSIGQVLSTALWLYVRYPVVFVGLSMAVVIPYWLIVLAFTNASPLQQGKVSNGTLLILAVAQFALVGPLVSALQVRAVLMIREHERPQLLTVVKRSLSVLPVVAAAEIIAGLGIGAFVGLAVGLKQVLYFVPGLYLAVRWAVVAQVAAVERTDWPTAIRRSATLARRNYLRIFAILFLVGIINGTVLELGSAVVGTRDVPGRGDRRDRDRGDHRFVPGARDGGSLLRPARPRDKPLTRRTPG